MAIQSKGRGLGLGRLVEPIRNAAEGRAWSALRRFVRAIGRRLTRILTLFPARRHKLTKPQTSGETIGLQSGAGVQGTRNARKAVFLGDCYGPRGRRFPGWPVAETLGQEHACA